MTLDSHAAVEWHESCSPSTVRRIASMLDVDFDTAEQGALLPAGWHFILLGASTPRSELRADGFPGLGLPLPDLGLPRLLQTGREVRFHSSIPVGSDLVRKSTIESVERKTTRAGNVAFVSTRHELAPVGASVAVTEAQTFVLMPPSTFREPEYKSSDEVARQVPRVHRPDDTLLFQYSALGFNSHKIHLDREYARTVEGFPDLVVNGGLTALLLTEYLRCDLAVAPSRIKIRYLAPLFCNRDLTIAHEEQASGLLVRVFNDQGFVACEMEVAL